jgi:hypothetical protein
MWLLVSVFAVLWILSVHYYMPFAIVVIFFAAAITGAAIALLPTAGSE